MSDEHHSPSHAHRQEAPDSLDTGSQALAEALRSSFAIVKIVMVLMVIAFFASGIFQVGPQEKAVILRLGKPVGEGARQLLGAGLHWSWPYPIDQVIKIPISEIQRVDSTTGWYFTTPDQQDYTGENLYTSAPLNPAIDGYALSADTNIVHVRATLYYRVVDPLRAVFGFSSDTNFVYGLAGVSNAVQNVLNNALLYTAAHYDVDDILTRDVGGFQDAVGQRAKDMIDAGNLGVVIDRCDVYSAPPRQLQDIFSQVATANQARNQAITEAHSYATTNLLAAGARAAAITNTAEIARTIYVTQLSADAQKFNDLLPKYERNPDLFVQVQVAQTMSQVLTNVEKWVVPDSDGGDRTQVRLMLGRELPQAATSGGNR